MNWGDERFVRVYTRDTTDWLLWSWEAQTVWLFLMRKFNRAGVIDLGKHGRRGLLAHCKLPWTVVETGLEELLQDGCMELRNERYLVARNFIEAQEAVQSDLARKRAERERHRDFAGLESVTNRDDGSQNRTESHVRSRAVTNGHSEPSYPIRSETDTSASPPVSAALTEARTVAAEAMAYWTEKTGRRAMVTDDRVKAVKRILSEGPRPGVKFGFNDIRVVIWSKVCGPRKWLGNDKMDEHLSPDTLLQKSKFAKYWEQATEEFAKENPAKAREYGWLEPPSAPVLQLTQPDPRLAKRTSGPSPGGVLVAGVLGVPDAD